MSQDAPFEQEAPEDKQQRLRFAGFWRRVGASLIDFLVLLVPLLFLVFLVDPGFLSRLQIDSSSEPSVLFTILSVVISTFYVALMESSAHQATLGKKAVGIKVTDLRGARIDFGTAVTRAWIWYLGAIGHVLDRMLGLGLFEGVAAIVVAVSCLAVAFTERKQGFHDMMAKCYVVRRPPTLGPLARA